MRIRDLYPSTRENEKQSYSCTIGLALLLLALVTQPGCGRSGRDHQPARPSKPSVESVVTEYLTSRYEQPKGDVWEEGKTYFLPDKAELEKLRADALPQGLSVFSSSVWSLHTGPEEFPVLVWVREGQGKARVGVMENPEEIAQGFPSALKSVAFSRPEARRDLALLMGEMMATFDGIRSTGALETEPEKECIWVERVGALKGEGDRIAAACFSEGMLERIILP